MWRPRYTLSAFCFACLALSYMDRCLDGGFRPGMGHVIPDRLFWAQPEDEDNDQEPGDASDFALPPHETRH